MEKSRIVGEPERIASGKFLELQNLNYLASDGKIHKWESVARVRSSGAVLLFVILRPSGRILLIRQFRPPAASYVWEFPAGLLEAGETPEGTAVRELREVTGYRGKVVSVLAGGINHVYPDYNKRLIDKVEKNALVISEQPPDYEVKPWMFPVRNRIIAGLAKGVLIAGGKKDSGARHTATFALEGGKDVYAFPYSVGIATGELNNYLIKNGAYLCDDVNDILHNLGIEKTEEKPLDLEEDQLKIYELIKSGTDGVDTLLEASGMKMYELAPVLTELEVGGFIVKLAGNIYKAKK